MRPARNILEAAYPAIRSCSNLRGFAGVKGTRLEPISPHGLRAGFVTAAYRNNIPQSDSFAGEGRCPGRPVARDSAEHRAAFDLANIWSPA